MGASMDTGFWRYVVQFHQGMSDGRNIADRYHRLSRMSDGELARHGLTRSKVSRAALNGF
jgi:hypothetical protein